MQLFEWAAELSPSTLSEARELREQRVVLVSQPGFRMASCWSAQDPEISWARQRWRVLIILALSVGLLGGGRWHWEEADQGMFFSELANVLRHGCEAV